MKQELIQIVKTPSIQKKLVVISIYAILLALLITYESPFILAFVAGMMTADFVKWLKKYIENRKQTRIDKFG